MQNNRSIKKQESVQNSNENVTESNKESSKKINLLDSSVRKCPKKMQWISFSTILLELEKDGIVNLKPSILNKKTNKMHKEGLHITCLPYYMYRTKCNMQISLRRRYYEYYCNKHCLTEGYIKAMLIFNNRKKFKGATNKKTHTRNDW